ncbi:MAG: hypothetical protein LC802_12890 [Acidobacteria bacterium]|nr:hypothetical protein [Acidobacteriota bacterium]
MIEKIRRGKDRQRRVPVIVQIARDDGVEIAGGGACVLHCIFIIHEREPLRIFKDDLI